MKISFLFPTEGQYTFNRNWLWWVSDELKKVGVEVIDNDCTSDCDVIICMTQSVIKLFEKLHNKYPDIPIITYNWDWFSFINKTEGVWLDLIEFMKKSIDVWTASDDTAKLCERELGIKHYTIYACSVFDEFKNGENITGDYVVQASRRDKRYKRFNLFEKACEDLKIPYISCHPKKYSREEYIKILKGCRLLVMAANEESNATLSAIEAAYCKKPLLLSDIEACKECFEDTAIYFKTDNLEDLKDKLQKMYYGVLKPDVKGAYKLAIDRYTPEAMALAIKKRLEEIL